MNSIVLPNGYFKTIPIGKFTKGVISYNLHGVKTIDEIRRIRLEMLIKMHGSKLANLNEALGYERTHSQLARIRNKNARTDRPGKFYSMGDEQAREIELKLQLEVGWMDTLPTYEDPSLDERMRILHKLAESLTPHQVDQLIKIGATLAEPAPERNGTDH